MIKLLQIRQFKLSLPLKLQIDMNKNIQAIRGMHDILPEQTSYWQYVERLLCEILPAYGYEEIRFPIVEQTQLFARAMGEVTDVVEKEMYTFEDRNGDSLSLRPEGTAGCVRAGIEHGLLYNQIQRVWYMGPMFRHERPQQGRCRQFHQFGVEAFGMPGPDIDAEQIFLMARVWDELGIKEHISLQINSLGSIEARKNYRKVLVDYFEKHQDHLDEDCKRRLTVNPLRILDSKHPNIQELIIKAPTLSDHLDEKSKIHFDGFRKLLDAAKIEYSVNERLVRGLDYYCLTVYEWVTDQLGAQGTVCAGGRYDDLVELLGGKSTPAVGFAMGFERIIALLKKKLQLSHVSDVYFILMGDKAIVKGLVLAEKWRKALPQLKLISDCGGGNFKNQFKRADKSGAKIALILGENELQQNKISVKFLREEREQELIELNTVAEYLKLILEGRQ